MCAAGLKAFRAAVAESSKDRIINTFGNFGYERWASSLTQVGIRQIVHIEPTLELFNRQSPKIWAAAAYLWQQDYQRMLVSSIRTLEHDQLMRAIAAQRLHFAPTYRNDPVVIVWEPTQQESAL